MAPCVPRMAETRGNRGLGAALFGGGAEEVQGLEA